MRDFQQSTLARPVPAAFFEEVVAQSLKMPARVWQSTFRALLDEDRSDDLARVAVPTTIVWGDQDAFSGRAEQERMAREIPQARLNVYAGTGHSPQWEEPARVAGDLLALLLVSGARRASERARPRRPYGGMAQLGRCAPLPPRSGGEGSGVGGPLRKLFAAVREACTPHPQPLPATLRTWVEGSSPPARHYSRAAQ